MEAVDGVGVVTLLFAVVRVVLEEGVDGKLGSGRVGCVACAGVGVGMGVVLALGVAEGDEGDVRVIVTGSVAKSISGSLGAREGKRIPVIAQCSIQSSSTMLAPLKWTYTKANKIAVQLKLTTHSQHDVGRQQIRK